MKRRQKRKISGVVFAAIGICGLLACKEQRSDGKEGNERTLPFIGPHEVEFRKDGLGTLIPDTVYYRIPKFTFTNQDGREISHRDYDGHIFIADFFFTHCPSICPLISSQLLRLQKKMAKENWNEPVLILSHTVDPTRDVPDTLKAYAQQLGADLSTWNFITGPAEDIYWQAKEGYMLDAFPSDSADGGFFHTDKLVLLDREMHIRGLYDGTSTKSVDQLFEDIKLLLNER